MYVTEALPFRLQDLAELLRYKLELREGDLPSAVRIETAEYLHIHNFKFSQQQETLLNRVNPAEKNHD